LTDGRRDWGGLNRFVNTHRQQEKKYVSESLSDHRDVLLTFTHTIGEFGVVLMVGGNIPGETKVISIAIYEHVETLRYAEAHQLSAGLLIFSFAVLFLVYALNRRFPINVS